MTNTKQSFYKQTWFIILMLIFIAPLGIFLMFKYTNWKIKIKIPAILLSLYLFLVLISDHSSQSNVNDALSSNQIYTSSNSTISNNTSEDSKIKNTKNNVTKINTTQHRENIYGISDKILPEKLSTTKVLDDVTNNWKLCTTSNNNLINFEKYALDYYNNIFNNDSEIHAIVNFANKTTSKLVSNGYNLYLTIYDYVKNEEHSAKTLFSGDILADYIIYLDNGDIEKIK